MAGSSNPLDLEINYNGLCGILREHELILPNEEVKKNERVEEVDARVAASWRNIRGRLNDKRMENNTVPSESSTGVSDGSVVDAKKDTGKSKNIPDVFSVRVKDVDTGNILRVIRGKSKNQGADFKLDSGSYPDCYIPDEDTPGLLMDGNMFISYVKFHMNESMLDEAKKMAINVVDEIRLNDNSNAGSKLSKCISAITGELRRWLNDKYRIDASDVVVKNFLPSDFDKLLDKADKHERIVSAFKYASSKKPKQSNIIKRSVVRLIETTNFIEEIVHPSVGEIVVSSVNEIAVPIDSTAFMDVHIRGLSCDIVYRKVRRH